METQTEDKTVAILSYITWVGWIIAIILHNNQRTELGAFHIRQTLGLYLTAIILWFIPLLGWILNLIVFIFWIVGLVNAINGQKQPVPLVGKLYQDLFKGIQ
mgnify:CR=1 FL=1